MKRPLAAKGKGKDFVIVLIAFAIFIIAGLWIGGTSIAWEVVKNLIIGVAIGLGLKVAWMLIGRTKIGRRVTGG